MDEKKIQALIKLMQETGVSEITVEEDGVRMTVRQGPLTIIEPANTAATSEGRVGRDSENVAVTPVETPHHQIKSPMVGTVYLSPAPDQDHFVAAGDAVEQGQTVCIIEAMKIMNEIASEESGTIVEVLVENGTSVEFGQPLFLYEPVTSE